MTTGHAGSRGRLQAARGPPKAAGPGGTIRLRRRTSGPHGASATLDGALDKNRQTAFAQALQAHPAPRRLGDVALRYAPSMLIGEADPPPRTLATASAFLVSCALTLSTVAAALTDASDRALVTLGLGAVAAFALTGVLEQRDRRHRGFVCNFETNSLRLDFSTPIAGRARTLVVHFDGVRSVQVQAQGEGRFLLTVDFVTDPDDAKVLREVLAAHVPARALEALERLQRVLQGAFGLGPAAGVAGASDGDFDRFEA